MPPPLTPLAIAVLSLLSREPMHPYEMRQRIRVQHIDRVMKVTQGTLYSTVERLAGTGLITPVETSREGRRPERTVYAITDEGRDQLADALREALHRPSPEYHRLAMALSFASTLDPEEVADLLERRSLEVEAQLSALNTALDSVVKHGLDRVHMIETEYLVALQRAELDWLRATVEDIRSGRMSWEVSGNPRPGQPEPDRPSGNGTGPARGGRASPGPGGTGDRHG
jgi:DNA-binding PadR family transcriptional regulator